MRTLVAAVAAAWLWCGGVPPATADATHPNIIYILVDDLGYGDLGCFHQDAKSGNKFDTPAIDGMAAEGMKLTHHYISAPVCAPSRASFLQGRHQGHADVRNSQFDKALADNHTVATVLKHAGYYTVHVGKNGLAGGENSTSLAGTGSQNLAAHPLDRGFDRFFGYLFHADGHEHYPRNGGTDKVAYIYDDYRQVTDAYLDLYTTDAWTAFAKQTIIDRATHHPGEPFFIYLAYDTPHFKMQYPPAPYPAGGGQTGGLQWTGTPAYCNTASNNAAAVNAYVHPDHAATGWPTSNKQHAGMIRRIDDGIGDLLQTLRELGIEDNTLVIFSSDNGPHNEGNDPRFFESFATMDGIKRDMWEAGIRVPTIAWWPGAVPANSVSAYPSGIWDWMATFADVAGLPAPAWCDGVSLVPSLTTTGTQRDKGYLYFEFNVGGSTPNWTEFEASRRGRARGEMQCIRVGDHMGIRTSTTSYLDPFEIYDVVADAKQTTNLEGTSPQMDALQQTLQHLSVSARRPGGGVSRPIDAQAVPGVSILPEPGLRFAAYEGSWPFVPEFRDLTPSATGMVATIDLSVRTRDDEVGLEFAGYLQVPATGVYTFYLASDAGAHLWIHDGHVIDDDFAHDGSERSGSVLLEAGFHPIRLYYVHGTGAHQLDVDYSGPGIGRQPLPASALVHPGVAGPVPVGTDDEAATAQGVPVEIDVLANDYDDGVPQPLTVVGVGPLAGGGTATVHAAGITYAPAPAFLGVDSFGYELSDGQYTSTAQVVVNVHYVSPDRVWMPFNEGTGLTTDEAGGYPLGTLVGFSDPPSPWVPGHAGTALQFDGVNDYVGLDASYVPPAGTAPRTLTAWIKCTGPGAIVAWGVKSGSQKWHWRIENAGSFVGALRIEVEGGYLKGRTDLRDNKWHHVALVWSDDGSPNVTDARLYVDGVQEAAGGSSGQAIATVATPVTIGVDGQGRHFAGIIDEVKIFRRALSTAELAAEIAASRQAASAWHTRFFGSLPVEWAADVDGDGVTRLGEYAFGGHPHIADVNAMALTGTVNLTTQALQATYNRRLPGTHDLLYSGEAASLLPGWGAVSVSEAGAAPHPLRTDLERATVEAASTEPAVFLRVSSRLAP